MRERMREIIRFGPIERTEHLLLLLSFTLLAISGLVQKFPENGLSLSIIRLLGGVENTRTLHHISAIALILLSIFHVFYVGYKIYVLKRPLTMLPGLKDVRDAIGLLKYNLGLSPKPPEMDRYNFGEKIEYWAVVWGTLVMAVSGYMLWNPVLTTRILPGEFIPAAKMAHGYEAILAVLSILIWHVWHVHIKHFNKSIFTGRISLEEMEEEHALELKRIEEGAWPPPLPPGRERWRRAMLYLPLAGLLSMLLLIATYYIFTEQTAITTLPPAPVEKAYLPAKPPGLPTATPAPDMAQEIPKQVMRPTPTPMPIASHPLDEARAACDACHAPFGYIDPAPLDHADYDATACTACHEPAKEVSQR